MNRRKTLVCSILLILFLTFSGKLFAQHQHGGGGGGYGGGSEYEHKEHQEKKDSSPVKFIEIKAPPKMTVKGTLTCPGEFLYRNSKGYGHEDEKCRISAIFVEKVTECDKSGKEDCPFEGKFYHILSDENSKKLINNKKYQNAKVSIDGRFYTDERILQVSSFRLLNELEIEIMGGKKP